MNRKGFMMAEVVVVSAIVMVTIVGLYQSYNKLYSAYTTRLKYYDAETLYRLGYYRDTLIENDKINNILLTMDKDDTQTKIIYRNDFDNNLIELSPEEYKYNNVLLIKNNNNTNEKYILNKETVANITNISETYRDYLNYLTTSTSYRSKYIMTIENCKENPDDCHYAYLEIFDIKEENK